MNLLINHNVSNNDGKNKTMIMDFPLSNITENSSPIRRDHPDAMEEYLRDVILLKFSTVVTLPSNNSNRNLNQLRIVQDNAKGSRCPRSKLAEQKYTIQQQKPTKISRWLSQSPVSTKNALEKKVTTTLLNAVSLTSSSTNSYFLPSNSNQRYQNANRWSSFESPLTDNLFTHQLIRPERLPSDDVIINLTCSSSSYRQLQEQQRLGISNQNFRWQNINNDTTNTTISNSFGNSRQISKSCEVKEIMHKDERPCM